MKKVIVEFQSVGGVEFRVKASNVTYRELLVLSRELRQHIHGAHKELGGDAPIIEVEIGSDVLGRRSRPQIKMGRVARWQVELVADEFHLAAQHIFFTQQNQAMIEAARNQQAIAALQRGAQGNSGLIFPGGR